MSKYIKADDKTQETKAMLRLLDMTFRKSKKAKEIKVTFDEIRMELKSNKKS